MMNLSFRVQVPLHPATNFRCHNHVAEDKGAVTRASFSGFCAGIQIRETRRNSSQKARLPSCQLSSLKAGKLPSKEGVGHRRSQMCVCVCVLLFYNSSNLTWQVLEPTVVQA